jgi:predicted RNA-binding Zn ribbon-like protein
MSKLQEAPGALEQVRAFVNTVDLEEGTEALSSAAGLADWLGEQQLGPGRFAVSEQDLRYAIELREALRAILLAHNGDTEIPPEATRVLDRAAIRAELRLRFRSDGTPAIEPGAAGVDGALGRLLAIVHDAVSQSHWTRLKACREHTCEWAFYDHTKNRSGAWCSMQSCGNRAKARAYRERRTGETP